VYDRIQPSETNQLTGMAADRGKQHYEK